MQKKIRKHQGIIQTGGNKGRLKKEYRYSGKKLKSGLPQIIKSKKKKRGWFKKKMSGGQIENKFEEFVNTLNDWMNSNEESSFSEKFLQNRQNMEHVVKKIIDIYNKDEKIPLNLIFFGSGNCRGELILVKKLASLDIRIESIKVIDPIYDEFQELNPFIAEIYDWDRINRKIYNKTKKFIKFRDIWTRNNSIRILFQIPPTLTIPEGDISIYRGFFTRNKKNVLNYMYSCDNEFSKKFDLDANDFEQLVGGCFIKDSSKIWDHINSFKLVSESEEKQNNFI